MSGDENSRRSEIRYETKTVQAVRGTVAKTIANWEEQGWQVVSQSEGLLRTEITLRRAKREINVRRYALIGAGAAVVVAAIVTVSVLAGGGGGGDEGTTTQQAAGTTATSTPPTSPAPPPATSSADSTEEPALTAENNADLAAILTSTNYCSSQIAAFAQNYQGRTIAFPASVANIANHDGASTRYDILLAPGDEGSTIGPAFQFRDVNTTSDLNFTGAIPESITVGTLLNITAEVDEYDANYGCLFRLQPVQTSFR